MSNPVTKIEIDDVLSSIRRLVSEDNRTEPAKAHRANPKTADRLLLTPAQRVTKGEVGAQTRQPDKPSTGALALDAYRTDAPTTQPTGAFRSIPHVTRVSEPAAQQVGPQDSSATEPEASESPPWKRRDTFLFQTAQLARKTDAAKRDRLHDANGEDEGDPPQQPAAQTEPPNEAGNTPQPVAPTTVRETEPVFSIKPRRPTAIAKGERESRTESASDADKAQAVLRAASLSAKIEALEDAIAETQDQWEPDGQGGDDYAGTPVSSIEWQERSDDADPQEPEQEPPHPDDVADATGDADQETEHLDPRVAADDLLNADNLRELVTDIVREELQGALGERITRNVRKLVRREIQRALTAQNMD